MNLTTVLVAGISSLGTYAAAALGPAGKRAEIQAQRDEVERSHRQSYYHQLLDVFYTLDSRVATNSASESAAETGIKKARALEARISILASDEVRQSISQAISRLIDLQEAAKKEAQKSGTMFSTEFGNRWHIAWVAQQEMADAMRGDVSGA